ncbi:hypothetical protein NDU88_002295 [Pleurodeles waltl]|uniref:Nuclear apoptosis-inducing factor 1 n=1 Tax=Pleurodeles waltl TaxID=8319 RepID=A0AAV7UX79_PLEWA|nr:hypothetical protein NDU88_002295 [Pleurodeles waltl]
MGVSHRSIEELKKLWYDLRSRTKVRVAERLREMRGTGGGPSTIPPPTPLEERVDETLEPEAVCGMGELDTSEPGPSTVAILVSEPAPGPSHSAGVEDTEPPLRRRRRLNVPPVPQAETGDASMLAAKAALLRGQLLQTQEIRKISGAMRRMEQNQNSGLQLVHTELQQLNTHVGDLALSMRQLVAELITEREGARRRDRQLMLRLDRMSASIVRLAVNTTDLSRRTVSLQVDMGHFASDVARGLGRLSHPVDLMEARQVARGTADTPQDSEEGSTVSSVLASDTRVLRSGSARQGTADTPGTSHAGRGRRRV